MLHGSLHHCITNGAVGQGKHSERILNVFPWLSSSSGGDGRDGASRYITENLVGGEGGEGSLRQPTAALYR